jgi:hypothetical protein
MKRRQRRGRRERGMKERKEERDIRRRKRDERGKGEVVKVVKEEGGRKNKDEGGLTASIQHAIQGAHNLHQHRKHGGCHKYNMGGEGVKQGNTYWGGLLHEKNSNFFFCLLRS